MHDGIGWDSVYPSSCGSQDGMSTVENELYSVVSLIRSITDSISIYRNGVLLNTEVLLMIGHHVHCTNPVKESGFGFIILWKQSGLN